MSEFTNPNPTPWGYIVDAETIPDLLTADEFNNFTASKYAGDSRVTANIQSATAAIRNFCGWHIAPSLTCGMIYRVADLRDAFVGPDLLVQLPATFVTCVSKIVLNAVLNELSGEYEGDVVDEYDLDQSGILRIYDANVCSRKSKIFIKYQAGLPLNNIAAIKELVANRVTHAVASSYGVMSEAAGGVSVTYSASWAGNTRSGSLPDDTREVLEPYRCKGVF